MGKDIIYDEEALDRVEKGVAKVADTVKKTLGPAGKNIILSKVFKDPQISNDGAYISRELEFDGTPDNTGAEAVKQAAIRTSENAGDGTTSSVILGHEMFMEARKAVSAGIHPNYLRRGMNKAVGHAVQFVYDYALSVEDPQEIEHVASMSAGGDESLGELIAEAVTMVGKDGIIRVEEGESMDTHLEFSKGVELDRGYISHDFVESEDDTVQLDNPLVMVADKRLTTVQDVLRPMEYAHQEGRPLFIMAHDVEGQALATLVENHNNNNVEACAVKAPRVDKKRTEIIDNIGVLTNAAVISDQTNVLPNNSNPDVYLGLADSVSVNKTTTTILGGDGDKSDVKKQIAKLRGKMESSGSEHDKEFYQKMASQMSGGMAIIRAGGTTETEMKKYKGEIEDALSATRAAIRTGIIPGGGVTYLEIRDYLRSVAEDGEVDFENFEERRGWDIFADSLESIFRQLLLNGEYRPDARLYEHRDKVESDGDTHIGQVFDVRTGEFVDAYEEGILEPALVADDILSNSVSIASSLIMSTCLVFGENEDGEEESDMPSMS
jgi:chaperonin GroEL